MINHITRKIALLWLISLLLVNCSHQSTPSAPTRLKDMTIPELEQHLDSMMHAFVEGESQRTEEYDARVYEFSHAYTHDDRLLALRDMYRHYRCLKPDSVLRYLRQEWPYITEYCDSDEQLQWRFHEQHLLNYSRYFSQAVQCSQNLRPYLRTRHDSVLYYCQLVDTYNRWSSERFGADQGEYNMSLHYLDSAIAIVNEQDPEYYNLLGMHNGLRYVSDTVALQRIKHHLLTLPFNTRLDAIEAHSVAWYYNVFEPEQHDSIIRYCLLGAIADIRAGYPACGSIFDLIHQMVQTQRTIQAYDYYDFLCSSARYTGNIPILVEATSILDNVRDAYKMNKTRQIRYLISLLVAFITLMIGLLYALWYIRRQKNGLSEAKQKLQEFNAELSLQNNSLGELNERLNLASHAREKYITLLFTICNDYLERLENLRITVHNNLIKQKYEDIRKLTGNDKLTKNELRSFLALFDETFLSIYPNFVMELNALLKPEERFEIPQKNQLNTELRICALLRMGVDNSQKIADFLHCSVAYVYNKRLHLRSSLAVPKEELPDVFAALANKY